MAHITEIPPSSGRMSAAILEALKQFPEVARAKAEIDAKSTGSVSFTIHPTPEIQSAVAERFGLPAMSLETIPMRWIKGDTLPHVDTGARSFDRTHLMYLTDSPGSFHIGDATYPITEGAAYSFAEGVAHETRGTGDAPRLLVGPMSEAGFAVGGPVSISVPGGTTVSIRSDSGAIQYSTDGDSWTNISSWPCTVINTNTAGGNVIVEFTTDITLTAQDNYFGCGSSNIQFGSTSLRNDGTRPVITVDGVTDYGGLIQNGFIPTFAPGFNNVYVYNLDVRAINGSTLYSEESGGAGWVCRVFFGNQSQNNYVINCTTDGPIGPYCGGIAGSYANYNGSSSGYIGCSSSGDLDVYAGGILGTYAGQTSDLTGNIECTSCWSTGAITGGGAGGIVAAYSTRVQVTSCYSEGVISGDGAGGIVGQNAAYNPDVSPGEVTVANCYSSGLISGNNSGGILGKDAQPIVTVSNCYTLGFITGTDAGGICGANPAVDTTVVNCYTTGTTASPSGYIVGGSATVGTDNYSEAANSSSGWNTTNANTVLLGLPSPIIGTAWVATVVNQPYELLAMGYTPYTTTNITTTPTPSLIRTHSTTVDAGSSTAPAIVSGKSYTILDITGGDAGSYGTIMMNSTTGVISTTTSTVPGTYTIYLRNTGSYNITTYELTVLGAGDSGACCPIPLNLKGLDYTDRAEALAGNYILVGPPRVKPLLQSDRMKMLKAYALRR